MACSHTHTHTHETPLSVVNLSFMCFPPELYANYSNMAYPLDPANLDPTPNHTCANTSAMREHIHHIQSSQNDGEEWKIWIKHSSESPCTLQYNIHQIILRTKTQPQQSKCTFPRHIPALIPIIKYREANEYDHANKKQPIFTNLHSNDLHQSITDTDACQYGPHKM